jgi:hypothetical protein
MVGQQSTARSSPRAKWRDTTSVASFLLLCCADTGAAVGVDGDAGRGCATDADCSYNGHCSSGGGGSGGACVCDAAWRGARCSTLNLLPAIPGAGLNTSDAQGPIMSWGGTVNHGQDGKWHMHVAQFTGHCGFNQWATNSRVVHAVADRPDGKYKVQGVVWPVWAHNPAVVRAPTGEWVMTFVSNTSERVRSFEARCDADGRVVANSSIKDSLPELQHNFMSVAPGPEGPWSTPVPIDKPLDDAVPPFLNQHEWPNRNTNIVLSIQPDGSMVGLWRRCCSPPPRYRPVGGGSASVIFSVHATDWRNVSTWRASGRPVLPELAANGYEDPHIYKDPAPSRTGVFHSVFHDMVGGWHQPEFNNTRVGAHAYSSDGGHTWVDTGVAFNLSVRFTDGSETAFIQRERPHMLLNEQGQPTHLVSGVTYRLRGDRIIATTSHGLTENCTSMVCGADVDTYVMEQVLTPPHAANLHDRPAAGCGLGAACPVLRWIYLHAYGRNSLALTSIHTSIVAI